MFNRMTAKTIGIGADCTIWCRNKKGQKYCVSGTYTCINTMVMEGIRMYCLQEKGGNNFYWMPWNQVQHRLKKHEIWVDA